MQLPMKGSFRKRQLKGKQTVKQELKQLDCWDTLEIMNLLFLSHDEYDKVAKLYLFFKQKQNFIIRGCLVNR